MNTIPVRFSKPIEFNPALNLDPDEMKRILAEVWNSLGTKDKDAIEIDGMTFDEFVDEVKFELEFPTA